MDTPTDRHARAVDEADTLSLVITQGATVSPDLVLRMTSNTRERLNRHRPVAGRCHYDGLTWPCADVAGDLAVFCSDDRQ